MLSHVLSLPLQTTTTVKPFTMSQNTIPNPVAQKIQVVIAMFFDYLPQSVEGYFMVVYQILSSRDQKGSLFAVLFTNILPGFKLER